MLTGLQPYHAANTEQLERMIRSRVPPPPAPDPCPEPLRRILAKAMAPDPEVRYATARDFAADLGAFRRGEPVRAATEDLDVTRRTSRDTEPTRRGVRWGGPGHPPSSWVRLPSSVSGSETRPTASKVLWPNTARPQKPPGPHVILFNRSVAAVVGAIVLYILWSVFSGYRLYGRGQDLERQVETEQVTDLGQIWNKWTELSDGNSSSWLIRGPRKVVKQKFLEAAGRVVASYRDDAKPLYEADWQRARTWFSHALAVEPDNATRGELRLCEGHLARINGTTHRNSAELSEAIQDFNEAQSLLPRSPDPELGLARVYVYGLKDIDKANDALTQAAKLGYKLGNRDQAELADGYCDRANRLWWDSHNVRGLPQEKDEISRAAEDYQTALKLYQSIAPYGNANVRIGQIGNDLDSVNFRLEQIGDKPPGGPSRQ
jgi:tetratricopeptide (TPR) repeat protein